MKESRYQGVPRFVYGSAFKGDQTAILTEKAIVNGFTGLDSAAVTRNYNEKLVGEGMKKALVELQISREQIWIQTKFSPYQQGKDPKFFPYDTTADFEIQIEQSMNTSLKHFENKGKPHQEYLDNLTLHEPYPNLEDTLLVWKKLENSVPTHIATLGISNVHLDTLTELFEKATIKPVLVQNRFTPDTDQSLPPFTPKTPYDGPVRRFCKEHGIVYQPWGILWGTCLPKTNQTLLQSELVSLVAREIDVTLEMAVYLLVLNLNPGMISILNGTKNEKRMKAAFDGLRKFEGWLDGNGALWSQYMSEFRKIIGDEEVL